MANWFIATATWERSLPLKRNPSRFSLTKAFLRKSNLLSGATLNTNWYENGKTRIIQKEIGRFSQIPLRLAYATTIHKSQGLSLDIAHIVLGNGCFAPGQLYTALSRVRTFEGLTLDREIKENDLFFAPEVVEFYKGIVPVDGASENQGSVILEVPAEYAETIKQIIAELRAEKKYSA